jgi:hypothetical protein
MAIELIGKYRVLNEIASGGQRAVFRAFDPTTGIITGAIRSLRATLATAGVLAIVGIGAYFAFNQGITPEPSGSEPAPTA